MGVFSPFMNFERCQKPKTSTTQTQYLFMVRCSYQYPAFVDNGRTHFSPVELLFRGTKLVQQGNHEIGARKGFKLPQPLDVRLLLDDRRNAH